MKYIYSANACVQNARVCYSGPGVFALKYLLMAISLVLSILLRRLCGRAHWGLSDGCIILRYSEVYEDGIKSNATG